MPRRNSPYARITSVNTCDHTRNQAKSAAKTTTQVIHAGTPTFEAHRLRPAYTAIKASARIPLMPPATVQTTSEVFLS